MIKININVLIFLILLNKIDIIFKCENVFKKRKKKFLLFNFTYMTKVISLLFSDEMKVKYFRLFKILTNK